MTLMASPPWRSLQADRALPCCTEMPVQRSVRLYSGCRRTNSGLLPFCSSGIACNSPLLATLYQLSKLQPAIHSSLRFAVLTSLPAAQGNLNPDAQHQTVTHPAPPGGLATQSVYLAGEPKFQARLLDFSSIISVPSQGTHTGLAKVAVQCSADTFVVNQSLVLRINICGEIRHLRQARNRYAAA